MNGRVEISHLGLSTLLYYPFSLSLVSITIKIFLGLGLVPLPPSMGSSALGFGAALLASSWVIFGLWFGKYLTLHGLLCGLNRQSKISLFRVTHPKSD